MSIIGNIALNIGRYYRVNIVLGILKLDTMLLTYLDKILNHDFKVVCNVPFLWQLPSSTTTSKSCHKKSHHIILFI